MKAYAAPMWVENGRCEQMIEVDEHGGEHDQVSLFPILPKEDPRNECWSQKMQGIVYNCLNYHDIFAKK